MKKSSDKLLFNKNSVKDEINYLIGITFKNHRFKRSTFSIAFAIWINLLLLSHNVKVIDLMTIHMNLSKRIQYIDDKRYTIKRYTTFTNQNNIFHKIQQYKVLISSILY